MDIFQFAMKMEKDGEMYYRELSDKTSHEGLKHILTMLAKEEVKHYQIIEKMSKESGDIKIVETNVLEKAKNIFAQMKKNGSDISFAATEVDLYKKAREIEKASRVFYSEKADEAEDESQKRLFLRLAEEEQQHEFLIENLIEFISRPDSWLENAEWNHLDAY